MGFTNQKCGVIIEQKFWYDELLGEKSLLLKNELTNNKKYNIIEEDKCSETSLQHTTIFKRFMK